MVTVGKKSAPKKKKKAAAKKPKHQHECAACGALFSKIIDHMNHYIENHDAEYRNGRDGSKKLYRKASCWSCAKEIRRSDDGRYRCSCGYVLPIKVDGMPYIFDEGPHSDKKSRIVEE